MKHLAVQLALALMLAACAAAQTKVIAKPAFQAPHGRTACLAAGGQWMWPGIPRGGEPDDSEGMCIVKLPDAGKPCTSSSQCMGTCRGGDPTRAKTTGVCSTDNYSAGCFTLVEGGVASAICAD